MPVQKVTPFLWFDHQAEDAMNHYVSALRVHAPPRDSLDAAPAHLTWATEEPWAVLGGLDV